VTNGHKEHNGDTKNTTNQSAQSKRYAKNAKRKHPIPTTLSFAGEKEVASLPGFLRATLPPSVEGEVSPLHPLCALCFPGVLRDQWSQRAQQRHKEHNEETANDFWLRLFNKFSELGIVNHRDRKENRRGVRKEHQISNTNYCKNACIISSVKPCRFNNSLQRGSFLMAL